MPKKTYLYHMLIGNNDKVEVDCFMFARNSGVAIDFCKELYREMRYNSYQAIKIGQSHILRETQIVPKENEPKIRQAIANKPDKYSEREIVIPEFVLKEGMTV